MNNRKDIEPKKKIKKRYIMRLNSYSIQERFYLIDNIIVTIVNKRDSSEALRFYIDISMSNDYDVCVKSIWKTYITNINYEDKARKLMKANPYVGIKEISDSICCSYNKARIIYSKLRREFSRK